MSDGVGIWVDFNVDTWLYIPMALPEGYSSPKKWAWDKSVEIGERNGLSDQAVLRLCKHIESLAASSNEYEHRFVLLKDLEEPILHVTVMFDVIDDNRVISDLITNEENDTYLTPFHSENLGDGLKALGMRVKKRVFRDDTISHNFRYAFIHDQLAITANASHEDQIFLLRHAPNIDSLVKSVIAVS